MKTAHAVRMSRIAFCKIRSRTPHIDEVHIIPKRLAYIYDYVYVLAPMS